MSNITGETKMLNFVGGSIPMFGVKSVSGAEYGVGITLKAGESLSIPFNKLITFIFPEEQESVEILNLYDRNGKHWTITLTWSYGTGWYPVLVWKIDGIGQWSDGFYLHFDDYKAGNEMVAYFTFNTTAYTPTISFNILPSFAYGRGPDFTTLGIFVNGVTRSPTFLTPSYDYENFPAGTTIGEIKTLRDTYYCINVCNDKMEFQYSAGSYLPLYGARSVITNDGVPGADVDIYNYIMQYAVSGPSITPGYIGIPDSTPGGNTGTYDFVSSDDIDFPNLPSISANTAGFVSLWTPTNNQLLTLAGYMWNDDLLSSQFWKKLIANPIDLIFGLNILPVNLTEYVDGTYSVVVGLVDTKILMRHLGTQWITVDCGEIDLEETWGAYLDYDPFTKLEIYLPFCGTHPLKIDDFLPGTIHVKYNIDLLTGSCIALVKSTKTDEHGDVLNSVVYQFMGNCATQIPVSGQQFADAIRSAISIAASIGTMVATGVGGAAAAIGAKTAEQGIQRAASTATSLINTGASAVENVMNLKPAIERSGAIGSSGSLLAVRKPYLILTRPRQAKPADQNVYTGYPSFITENLDSISGWTIVQAIHLDNIPCTANEMNEIDSLLKAGVIF